MWFELDKKKEGNKEIIYRSYTIKSNYIKLNDCFWMGKNISWHSQGGENARSKK